MCLRVKFLTSAVSFDIIYLIIANQDFYIYFIYSNCLRVYIIANFKQGLIYST